MIYFMLIYKKNLECSIARDKYNDSEQIANNDKLDKI